MSKHVLEADITCHATSQDEAFSADLETRIEQWKRGEPVPSEHFKIGAFHIAKPVLEQALAELQDLSNPAQLTYDGSTQRWIAYGSLPPFLQGFVETSGNRMMNLITGRTSTVRKIITHIILGPYEMHPDNVWHRDSTSDPGGRTYVSTLFGPTTEYALGVYRNDQFEDEFFQNPGDISETTFAQTGAIYLHDKTFTLHQAPVEEQEGRPRIFYSSNVG